MLVSTLDAGRWALTAEEAEEEEPDARDLLQHGALRVLLYVQLIHRRDLDLHTRLRHFNILWPHGGRHHIFNAKLKIKHLFA